MFVVPNGNDSDLDDDIADDVTTHVSAAVAAAESDALSAPLPAEDEDDDVEVEVAVPVDGEGQDGGADGGDALRRSPSKGQRLAIHNPDLRAVPLFLHVGYAVPEPGSGEPRGPHLGVLLHMVVCTDDAIPQLHS